MNKRDHSGEVRQIDGKYRSTAHYILSSLIPYTEANLKLSFKPTAFFNDLEKIDAHKAKHGTLRSSYYQAIKKGLIEIDKSGVPCLTEQGLAQLQRYEPKRLQAQRAYW